MLAYTSLHLHIYFQMIVFVFSMFAESDEKTPQACCDENHAWCEDVISNLAGLRLSLANAFFQIKQRGRYSLFSDMKAKPY